MNAALASYLAEVEAGLRTAPSRSRRRILRELECHLLDEAEARGLQEDSEIRAMLREKEHPRDLAREILASDDESFRHRGRTKLLAGALLGATAGGYMFIVLGHPLLIALAYGLAQGLLVAGGLFWLRRAWQVMPPASRLLTATLFGTLLALPLGFTTGGGSFAWTRLLYGGFTGYLAERLVRERTHSGPREVFYWMVENVLFTTLLYCVAAGWLQRVPWPHAEQVIRAMSFNLILQLGAWAAVRLHRRLDERWVLSAKRL